MASSGLSHPADVAMRHRLIATGIYHDYCDNYPLRHLRLFKRGVTNPAFQDRMFVLSPEGVLRYYGACNWSKPDARDRAGRFS